MTGPQVSAVASWTVSALRSTVLVSVAGLGLVVAALGALMEPASAAGAIFIGVLVGGGLHLRELEKGDTTTDAGSAWPRRRTSMLGGAAAAGLCAELAGLASLLGGAGPPVILVLALVGVPWSWRALHRARQRPAAPAAVPRQDRPTRDPRPFLPTPAAESSTAELCLAWQRSYWALLDTPAGAARDRLVSMRGELLDELCRRDRAGFARWIDAGARAGSDPGRYLGTGG